MLIRVDDFDNLEDVAMDYDSDVLIEWEAIEWAKISVPSHMELQAFVEEVDADERVLFCPA